MNAKYLEIEPAGAKAKPDRLIEPLWEDPMWIAEPKMDGYRALFHIGKDLDRVYVTSRNMSVKTGKLSEKGRNAASLWPERREARKWGYTVIDGEILPPLGYGFRDLAGIMRTGVAKARERVKEIGSPRFFPFDLLFANGKDMREEPWTRRQQLLLAVVSSLWSETPTVRVVDCVYGSSKRRFYEAQVRSGGEGVILKDMHAPYGKSGAWLKVKRYSTIDVIVTGFTDANHGVTGKYDGLVGAVEVSVYKGKKLVQVAQVSGFTDELRKDFTKRKKHYLGSVIEVKAQWLAKEKLQHPQFGRLRPDADPRHCTWEKMLADLEVSKR